MRFLSKNQKITFKSLYEILLAIIIFTFAFSESQLINTGFAGIINIIKYACPVMMFLLIICSKTLYRRREWYVLLSIIFASVIGTFVFDGGAMMLLLVITILGACKLNIDDVFCVIYRSLICSYLVVSVLALLGIIENVIDTRYIGDYMGSFFSGQYIRHSVGFLNSNQIPTTFLICYLLLILWRGEIIPLWKTIVIQIFNYFLFLYFGSRISFVLTILTGVLFCWRRYKSNKSKPYMEYYIICATFLFCFIVSIYCAYAYNPSSLLWNYLDLFFNNRLRLSHEAINIYNISLFGYGKIAASYDALAGVNVDNGYLQMLIQRGVIITTVVLALLVFGTRKLVIQNKYTVLVFFIFAVENLINPHILSYKAIPLYCLIFASWRNESLSGEKFLNTLSEKKKHKKLRIVLGK